MRTKTCKKQVKPQQHILIQKVWNNKNQGEKSSIKIKIAWFDKEQTYE